MKIVIPDDFTGAYRSSAETVRLRAVADVQIFDGHVRNPDELIARVRDADVILSFRPAFTKFPAAVTNAWPKLRMICISGTGVEDVDVVGATKSGIAVASVVGSSNRAVAEHTLALMFDVARPRVRDVDSDRGSDHRRDVHFYDSGNSTASHRT